MSLFSISLILLFTMDPLGNLSSYLSLVHGLEARHQRWVIIREMAIALFLMMGFYFIGEFLLAFIGLSETTLRLSSGVILFLIAIKILFASADNPRAHLPKGEPLIFPLAVPLIAGPALIATIMLYSHLEQSEALMLPAILIAWSISITIFFCGQPIKRLLGVNGLKACERLIGMVLVLVAVQRLLEGIILFWSSYSQSFIS